jgi:acyl-CoA thioesterase FadM
MKLAHKSAVAICSFNEHLVYDSTVFVRLSMTMVRRLSILFNLEVCRQKNEERVHPWRKERD